MSQVIQSKAPLGMDDLKKIFEDKDTIFEFNIAEQDEIMQGRSLLIYAANLGMRTRITNISPDFLREYMTMATINQDVDLPRHHANILFLARTGRLLFSQDDEDEDIKLTELYTAVIKDNMDMVVDHCQFIDSMMLFVRLAANEDEESIKEFADEVELSTRPNIGLNVVKLFELEEFLIEWFGGNMKDMPRIYFEMYFKEYMFQGKNLFSFFAVPENMFFKLAMVLMTKAESESE